MPLPRCRPALAGTCRARQEIAAGGRRLGLFSKATHPFHRRRLSNRDASTVQQAASWTKALSQLCASCGMSRQLTWHMLFRTCRCCPRLPWGPTPPGGRWRHGEEAREG
ncbi:hypothetical protein ACK3TF_001818 [Chlorella vulgaris]